VEIDTSFILLPRPAQNLAASSLASLSSLSVPKEKAKRIRKALEEFGNVSERSMVKIIEIMPKNNMTLRQILASERKSFSDEEVNKILALTKEK
jgi:DNA-directed RNA polymerase subunit F